MNREELLKNAKPILFNTEMVQAILDNRKTVTRRKIDRDITNSCDEDVDGTLLSYHTCDGEMIDPIYLCRYKVGDILYVRETWQLLPSGFDEIPPECWYIYKATDELSDECTRWRPSIHMPKEAARIFLKVTNVRVERLQEITDEQAEKEGFYIGYQSTPTSTFATTARQAFMWVWNKIYSDINPWVWVIEFERVVDANE